MGKSYKAERIREKVLLRQFSCELNNFLEEAQHEIRRAETISIIATAEELTGQYFSAKRSYESALNILNGVMTAIEEDPEIGETLADVVENEIKQVKESLRPRTFDAVVSPEYLSKTKPYRLNFEFLNSMN